MEINTSKTKEILTSLKLSNGSVITREKEQPPGSFTISQMQQLLKKSLGPSKATIIYRNVI